MSVNAITLIDLVGRTANPTPPKVHELRKLPITDVGNRTAFRARTMMMTASEVQ
jgi:hypothetical protein